jgi:hypothetical protein
VYRNLKHGRAARPFYSVKDKATGRVIDRLHCISVANATFVVSEAGRQRVLREKRKNVHAYVEGEWVPTLPGLAMLPQTIRYNPYLGPYFITHHGQPVRTAELVLLNAWGMTAKGAK